MNSKNNLRSGIKCCISNCNVSKRLKPEAKMFQFPLLDTPMGQIWREKCGINLNNSRKKLFICNLHFFPQDIGKKKLKNGAVPSLNLNAHVDNDDPENFFCLEELPRRRNSSCSNLSIVCSKCEKFNKTTAMYRKKNIALEKQNKNLKKNLKML